MPYLLGTDEAGYGPNLGPLVVALTAWRIPGNPREIDLYKSLENCVCAQQTGKMDQRVVVADSKQVYQPGKGLAGLERAVLAVLSLMPGCGGLAPQNGHELLSRLGHGCGPDDRPVPWPEVAAEALPVDCPPDAVHAGASLLKAALGSAGVTLTAVRCVAVFPARFNALTERFGTKGEALSRLTLQLAAEVLAGLPPEPAYLICDRHGGRARYGALLQDCFPDSFVEVRGESPTVSSYRWGSPECRTQAEFCVGGERHFPVAMASMVAKYVRELSMRAFNAFWCARVPALRPTAGYPMDARRFKIAIASAQADLGVTDDDLWRNR